MLNDDVDVVTRTMSPNRGNGCQPFVTDVCDMLNLLGRLCGLGIVVVRSSRPLRHPLVLLWTTTVPFPLSDGPNYVKSFARDLGDFS